jgi:hypothetical protein
VLGSEASSQSVVQLLSDLGCGQFSHDFWNIITQGGDMADVEMIVLVSFEVGVGLCSTSQYLGLATPGVFVGGGHAALRLKITSSCSQLIYHCMQ